MQLQIGHKATTSEMGDEQLFHLRMDFSDG